MDQTVDLAGQAVNEGQGKIAAACEKCPLTVVIIQAISYISLQPMRPSPVRFQSGLRVNEASCYGVTVISLWSLSLRVRA